MLDRVRGALAAPSDAASLAVFRVGFGVLATIAAVRFVALGWVEELLVAPAFHFVWLDWIVVPDAGVLYALFAVQAIAGLGIAVGFRVRACLVLWLASFGYVELLDKTLYLNHYVLFTILGVFLLVTPAAGARLRGLERAPGWVLWLFRAQVALVYFWAGLAKLNADWLLRAEPLATWLGARADFPFIGTFLAFEETAFAMSWAGAIYDLAIPFVLLHPKTRRLGVLLVAAFHLSVGLLFPIGIFPVLMMLSATLFLSPSWPRRYALFSGSGAAESVADEAPGPRRASYLSTAAFAGVVTILALFPGRFLLQGTDVCWTEQGYRFSWRVMLIEKTGLVDFRVVDRATGGTRRIMPATGLTPLQHQHMRTQPDMIRDYALHLRATAAAEGRNVAVYADSWASLNGRPSQRLLRPDVDLTAPYSELEQQGWIVPLEEDAKENGPALLSAARVAPSAVH